MLDERGGPRMAGFVIFGLTVGVCTLIGLVFALAAPVLGFFAGIADDRERRREHERRRHELSLHDMRLARELDDQGLEGLNRWRLSQGLPPLKRPEGWNPGMIREHRYIP